MKRNRLPAHPKAPVQQRGGEDLTAVMLIMMRWTRGEMSSDQALFRVGEVVGKSSFFESALIGCGWIKKG